MFNIVWKQKWIGQIPRTSKSDFLYGQNLVCISQLIVTFIHNMRVWQEWNTSWDWAVQSSFQPLSVLFSVYVFGPREVRALPMGIVGKVTFLPEGLS